MLTLGVELAVCTSMLPIRHRQAHQVLLLCSLAACGDDAVSATSSADAASTAVENDAGGVDPCISQCELAAGRCAEKPLSAFGTLEETTAAWMARCPASPTQQRPFLIKGRCVDGSLLLHVGGAYTSERHYFSTDGSFLSLMTTTDVSKDECRGRGYWPVRPACESPEVTEVLCGQSPWPVGAAL